MAMDTLIRSTMRLWRFLYVGLREATNLRFRLPRYETASSDSKGSAVLSFLKIAHDEESAASCGECRLMPIFLCLFCCLFFGLLAACSSNRAAPLNNVWDEIKTTQTRYTVQAGDTFYSIAWRFNLSDEQLARWNNLHRPYALHVGQTVRLTPSAAPAEVLPQHAADPAQPIAPAPSFIPIQSQSSVSSAKQSNAVAAEDASIDHVVHAAAAAPTIVSGHGTWPWPAKGSLLATYGQSGNKGIDIALPTGSQVKAVQAGTVVYSGANLHDYGRLLIVKQKNDLITAYAHNSKLLVVEGDHVTQGQVIALSGDSEATKPMLHFEVRKLGKTVNPLQYLDSGPPH